MRHSTIAIEDARRPRSPCRHATIDRYAVWVTVVCGARHANLIRVDKLDRGEGGVAADRVGDRRARGHFVRLGLVVQD
jgi:hypothetical protein